MVQMHEKYYRVKESTRPLFSKELKYLEISRKDVWETIDGR